MWTLLKSKLSLGLLLNPWVWAVAGAALIASHGWMWASGAASKQQAWDAANTMQAQATLKASEAARTVEQQTATKLRKANDDLQLEKKRRAADAVRSADSLRDFRATLYSIAPGDTARAPGIDDDPRTGIVAECASALVDLDAKARSLAIQTTALQNYAASVRVSK